MRESRRPWVVALVVLAGVSMGVDGAWSMEQEWCFHEDCRGYTNPTIKMAVPPGATDDLGFHFSLKLSATFPPESQLTFMQAKDASGEVVFELSAFGDLVGQKWLVLLYKIASDEDRLLFLGPAPWNGQDIEVSRVVVNGFGAIAVRQGSITYDSGFTPLYGDPVVIYQGLLFEILEPSGHMWMSFPEIDVD